VDVVCDNVTVDIFNGRNSRLFRCLSSPWSLAAGSAHARRRRNAKRIRAESSAQLCSRDVSRSPSDCSLRELHAHTITFSATTVPVMMHAAQPRQMELSPTQKASSLGRYIARAGALRRRAPAAIKQELLSGPSSGRVALTCVRLKLGKDLDETKGLACCLPFRQLRLGRKNGRTFRVSSLTQMRQTGRLIESKLIAITSSAASSVIPTKRARRERGGERRTGISHFEPKSMRMFFYAFYRMPYI